MLTIEQNSYKFAEALAAISAIVDRSESDPAEMQNMLIQIYRIADRAILDRSAI